MPGSAQRLRARRLAAHGIVLATAVLVVLTVRAGAAPSAPPAQHGHVRKAQVIEEERTGVASPAGLAFSTSAGRLYAIGARRGRGAAADTDVAVVAPFRRPAGPALVRIAAAVHDPINVVFDEHRRRLLLLGDTGELLEVKVDAAGTPQPQALRRRNAVTLRLQEPRGMTVDAAGTVFVLDAAGPRIVRVAPGANGSLGANAPSEIDLRRAGLRSVRGLALHPSTGHFHVRSGSTLVEIDPARGIIGSRDLSGTGLVDPQALVFAPSGDRTDDPAQQSLYVADAGGAAGTGQIVELSLAPAGTGQIAELSLASAAGVFTSSLIRTVDLGAISPPSTDPGGITYVASSDRFVITDSEIEESVTGITHFQGANVWEVSRLGVPLRTANISKVAPTSVPMANEPAGIAFHPGTGHYYVSDDGVVRIFDLNPGTDGLIGTADDSFGSFLPIAENADPEGIAVDSFSGRLFVADGVNGEVYEYTTTGQYVGQFDVAQYGIGDPESVEFNPLTGTLFILSDRQSGTGNQTLIVETTTGGALVQTIDISAANAFKPGGLAYAPASDGSGAMRFYVVDRGIDNNPDPNAVDGKLYELTAPAPGAPANTPPTVDADASGTATLPAGVALDGTVSDDGNPNGAVTVAWTQVSGPGVITFADAAATDTTASATGPGDYVVRLTANDGEFTAYDEVTITFEGAPTAQSLDIRIAMGIDDAEERPDTTSLYNNADLDMMSESGGTPETNAVVGMRFRNVTIPRDATITFAYVQFQARRAHSTPTLLTIHGEDTDDSALFTGLSADLSGRETTDASVDWAPDPWLAAGDAGLAQRTANIASVVQEIVDRSGWASGNALTLLVTGSGSRVAESFNGVGAGAAAPLLHVEWTLEPENAPPAITSDGGGDTASLSVPENGTAVTAVAATDGDGDALEYSLVGGADAARFTIGSSSGVLAFVAAPDFEAPLDANVDNVYEVTVRVSDGNGGSDEQSLAVTVTDVADTNRAPTASAGADMAIALPGDAALKGTVSDDGRPTPPGALTASWSKMSGPGTVSFGNHSAVDTTASFSAAGTYVLRLAVSDGALEAHDDVTVTVSPAPDAISADGFESGSFSAWSGATTGGGDLSVSSAARSSGSYGMRAVVNDNGPLFVFDDTPAAEKGYMARFYFHPNGISMRASDSHTILHAAGASGAAVIRVELRYATRHQVRAGVLTDTGSYRDTGWIDLTNAWHPIEISWRAATAPGANNGGLILWVDGWPRGAVLAADNDLQRVDSVRLGAVEGIDTTTRGTTYFDAFVSRRYTLIGR